jgi:hypothetical protein
MPARSLIARGEGRKSGCAKLAIRAGVHDHRDGMNLTGDPDGLAVLKSFQEGKREYLKFLIQEARSVFEHHVDFKGPDGAQFRLTFDVRTGDFRVDKKP